MGEGRVTVSGRTIGDHSRGVSGTPVAMVTGYQAKGSSTGLRTSGKLSSHNIDF